MDFNDFERFKKTKEITLSTAQNDINCLQHFPPTTTMFSPKIGGMKWAAISAAGWRSWEMNRCTQEMRLTSNSQLRTHKNGKKKCLKMETNESNLVYNFCVVGKCSENELIIIRQVVDVRTFFRNVNNFLEIIPADWDIFKFVPFFLIEWYFSFHHFS